MLIAIVVAGLAGALLPIQTVINTRLARTLGATFLASLISFAVGTLTLGLALLAVRPALDTAALSTAPWWIWTGGLAGVIFLTFNMVLMRNLGASVTVILPIVGQVVGGLVIDTFGLMNTERHPLTTARLVGTIIVLLGALVVNLGKPPTREGGPSPRVRTLLMILGVLAGVISSIQLTVNGRLGVVLHSALAASFVSFVVGTACLVVINLIVRPRIDRAAIRAQEPRWWLASGGAIGALFVLGNTIGAPILGTSMTVSVVLFGQIVSGLCVDHFGVFGTAKRPVTRRKMLGTIIVLVGIACVRLLGS